MNHNQFHEQVLRARDEGFRDGRRTGRNDIQAANQRDLDQAWNNGHSRGIVVGSLIGAFLFSAVGGGLALIFL